MFILALSIGKYRKLSQKVFERIMSSKEETLQAKLEKLTKIKDIEPLQKELQDNTTTRELLEVTGREMESHIGLISRFTFN